MRKPYQYPGGCIYTPPAIGKCRECRALILECHVGGMPTQIDPVALTLPGQINALENDRDLYEITLPRIGKAAEVVERNEARILSRRPHIALASHQCHPPAHESVDQAAQARLDAWLYPAHPARSAHPPPF